MAALTVKIWTKNNLNKWRLMIWPRLVRTYHKHKHFFFHGTFYNMFKTWNHKHKHILGYLTLYQHRNRPRTVYISVFLPDPGSCCNRQQWSWVRNPSTLPSRCWNPPFGVHCSDQAQVQTGVQGTPGLHLIELAWTG